MESKVDTPLSEQRVARRVAFVDALKDVPDEALERLQYFQPEVGCFSNCSFCSQEAGTNVWQLDPDSVEDLVASIAIVSNHRCIAVASGRKEHRPGVLFPYLDNDCFSYPYLDTYLREVHQKLGVKVRVATVGYSRHNKRLTEMHSQIVDLLGDAFAGIRFSFTPYTGGWAAMGGSKLSRDEYEADMSEALQTYMPLMERLGLGKSTACVELRFHPHIQLIEVTEFFMDGNHVIHAGPHIIVSSKPMSEPMPITRIRALSDAEPIYDQEPVPYLKLTDDQLVKQGNLEEIVSDLLSGVPSVRTKAEEVPVYRFENCDGVYYAICPTFMSGGEFRALHIYPQTTNRPVSGYNDASRYFMNAILKIKAHLGYSRRDQFDGATWDDISLVMQELQFQAGCLKSKDVFAALHIREHILPLVESFIRVLRMAKLSPRLFFDPRFTIDTGQIVNQGRAKKHFRGLISRNDKPFTPREARAYGDEQSVSAKRGRVWRLVPMPFLEGKKLSLQKAGGKTIVNESLDMAMVFHEVSEHNLRPTDAKTGEPLRRFLIPGVNVVSKMRHESWNQYLQPGVARRNKDD